MSFALLNLIGCKNQDDLGFHQKTKIEDKGEIGYSMCPL